MACNIKQNIGGLCCYLFLITACVAAPPFDSVYRRITDAALKPGQTIPLPQGKPMLTVTGKIGAANAEENILMDLATIEAVGIVEYTVQDPFEERKITYRGALMRDLLNLWQVADNAQTIKLVALNDYVVEIPIAEFRQYPILFALQADGEYMSPKYRGPAMLVYPLAHYSFEPISVQSKWIWQIKEIEVR